MKFVVLVTNKNVELNCDLLILSSLLLLLFLLFHLGYLYTRFLWSSLHTTPVIHSNYVTSSIERHSSSFRFLLFLCNWIKIAAIWLRFQLPKPDMIQTWSCVFHADLSHWALVVPSSFNRHWTCPVNTPEYATCNPFYNTENSHRIAPIIASSSYWSMMPFEACT